MPRSAQRPRRGQRALAIFRDLMTTIDLEAGRSPLLGEFDLCEVAEGAVAEISPERTPLGEKPLSIAANRKTASELPVVGPGRFFDGTQGSPARTRRWGDAFGARYNAEPNAAEKARSTRGLQ
jgi:hypothetical protein